MSARVLPRLKPQPSFEEQVDIDMKEDGREVPSSSFGSLRARRGSYRSLVFVCGVCETISRRAYFYTLPCSLVVAPRGEAVVERGGSAEYVGGVGRH